jgi:hypothetical protein
MSDSESECDESDDVASVTEVHGAEWLPVNRRRTIIR